MPANGYDLSAAGKDLEWVQFSRPNSVTVAINAHPLRWEADPDQRRSTENFIRELCSGDGVDRIFDIDIDGDDFSLNGKAAAKGFSRLVVIDGSDEVRMIPLCSIKAGPAAHRRHFRFLPTWKGPPPEVRKFPGDGRK
jgi:hypothetical protein